jgi:hypothetical protein
VKLALMTVVAALTFTGAASAHLVRVPDHPEKSHLENQLASQTENVKHLRYVCRNGRSTWTKTKWHCYMQPRIERERQETLFVLFPPAPSRVSGTGDACLDELIDRETAGTWDPGIWNSQGSGAFGLPQALPYTKLPKAGWPKEFGGQEDPHAQIGWMRGYVNGRYGGSCSALAFHDRNGWY